MQVILLEKIRKLGALGDVVKVKDGYARNFLLPQQKALRATKENLEQFEQVRAEREKQDAEKKADAQKIFEVIDGAKLIYISQSGDDGRLYGSVGSKEIVKLIADNHNVQISSAHINLDAKIKDIGIYQVAVEPHPEVQAIVHLNIARSAEEAKAAFAAKEEKEIVKQEDKKRASSAKKAD